MSVKCEGIVLRAVPYQDCHHIVTLFTAGGLLPVFVRGTHRSRHFSHAIVTPLTRAEFDLRQRPNSNLHTLLDAKALDQHLVLRTAYPALEAGCEMASALLLTQMENKPAPRLYALVAHLLHKLTPTNALTLTTTFLLKLLKHEGLSAYHRHCSICEKELLAANFLENEAYCPSHSPPGAVPFSETERAKLLTLSASQKWEEIEATETSQSLRDRMKKLFESLTH